jgi:ABC-type glycerol-3-phosphate transport system substrate-binding protein
MRSKKLLPLLAVFVVLSLISAQCGATPTPEKIVETVIVTKEVEVAGEKVVETVVETVVVEVEVEKEVVVTATPEPEPEKEEVTLVFSDWHLTEPHWEKSLKEAFETFEAEHPNIKLELDYVSYGDKDTKYATEIQAGAGPDVIHLHAYSLRSFIERGFLMDITPFIEEEGDDAFLSPWYPQTLAMMQYEGAYYAIPGDFMSMALFYNTNLYEEAGLDPSKPPATWDEFLEYAQALTRDRDGDGQVDTWGFGTMGAIAPGFELRFSPILFSHGGDYLNEDYTCSALNTPEAKEAFAFFTGLFTEYEVIPLELSIACFLTSGSSTST